MAATGLQYAAASQQAKDESRYQNQQYKSVSSAAIDSYVRGVSQLQLRGQQEGESASAAAVQNARDANAAQGQAAAHLAGAGVTGNSATVLLRDFDSIEAVNESGIRTGYRWHLAQLNEEVQGLRANAQSRISSAAPRTIRGPSALALGVSMAAGAAQGASNLYNIEMKSRYGAWFGGGT